jgi:catechol-2,3-dioxygenase
MSTPADLRQQGNAVPTEAPPRPIDPGVRIGHVHLRTADIDRVKAFYVGVLGFDVVAELRDIPGWGTTGDALFVSAGGYHHHLAFNVWRGEGVGPAPPESVGLRLWTVMIDPAALSALRERVEAAGLRYEEPGGGLLLRDPWSNAVLFTTSR